MYLKYFRVLGKAKKAKHNRELKIPRRVRVGGGEVKFSVSCYTCRNMMLCELQVKFNGCLLRASARESKIINDAADFLHARSTHGWMRLRE